MTLVGETAFSNSSGGALTSNGKIPNQDTTGMQGLPLDSKCYYYYSLPFRT